MGASTTISHAILMIAAIIIASVFAFTVILKTSSLTSSVSQIIFSEQSIYQTQITVAELHYDTNTKRFELYVKNTGFTDISPELIQKMDIYLEGSDEGPSLYVYSPVATQGQWNYTKSIETVPEWVKGETIIIHIYNSTEISPPYHVKIILPNGVGTEFIVGE